MTVAQLIEQLKGVPQEFEVWVNASTHPDATLTTMVNTITHVTSTATEKIVVISATWRMKL